MTSVEEISATRTQPPDRNQGGLSSEDTLLLQTLCSAMRNVDFMKFQACHSTIPTVVPNPADPNVSQAGNDREGGQQARGLTTIDSNANDFPSEATDGIGDSQLDTGGSVRLNTAALETGRTVNDTDETSNRRDNEMRSEPVAEQTTGGPNADLNVTRKSVIAAGSIVEKNKNKPDENDIYHQLYKRFKDVNDKLQLLENAISRLGGVGDVLRSIRQLRAALVLALRLDDLGSYLKNRVMEGELDSAEKVLAHFRDWGDLMEDGTVFGFKTDHDGEPLGTFSDVKLIAGRVANSAEVMGDSFEELGTVNGCQFVSLCTSLRAVRYETWSLSENIMHFNCAGDKAKKLLRERLSGKLHTDMSALSEEISKAIERDIPNLRTAEQRLTDKYTSMTTTAAFFSGITVTAIQMSSPTTGNILADAANTVWFTSLVFSVASVIASLIGSSYFQSHIPIRKRDNLFKRGVIFLLRNGPAMLMTAAAAFFMVGLALFVNASNQAKSTSKIVTRLIISVSAVLVFLSLCFVLLYGADVTLRLWRKIVRFGDSVLKCLTRFVFRNSANAKSENDLTKTFFTESDSGRKPMPLDIGKMQVGLGAFDGPFAVTNSETSSLQIYKSFNDISPISNIIAKSPIGDVKELLWSSDNEYLLIRTDDSLKMWSNKDHVLSLIHTSSEPIKAAVWTMDSNILAIQSQSFIHIDLNTGDADDPKKIPSNISIVSAHCLADSDEHLVCIADEISNDTSVRKLLVMNYITGETVYGGTEIRKISYSLQLSEGDGLTKVLLSFTDGFQLWNLIHHNLTSWEVEPNLKYVIGGKIFASSTSFAGSRNELVVCSFNYDSQDSKVERILVWSTDDATLIHRIDITEIYLGLPTCISWKVDDAWTLVFAAAYDDGKVVKGSVSLLESIDGWIGMTSSNVQMVVDT